MNHFINISDLNKDDLRSIIDSAKKKKSERGKKSASQPDNDQPLQGKNIFFPIFPRIPSPHSIKDGQPRAQLPPSFPLQAGL